MDGLKSEIKAYIDGCTDDKQRIAFEACYRAIEKYSDEMIEEIEDYSVETKLGKVVLLDKVLEILGTQKGT